MLIDLRKKFLKRNILHSLFFKSHLLKTCVNTQFLLISTNIVYKGKASRYGNPFVDLIANYVSENNIERPQDITVKLGEQIWNES